MIINQETLFDMEKVREIEQYSRWEFRYKSLEKRKMAECTPKEQIIKINTWELRKKQIGNNNQFKEVVDMIRETDYIDRRTPCPRIK